MHGAKILFTYKRAFVPHRKSHRSETEKQQSLLAGSTEKPKHIVSTLLNYCKMKVILCQLFLILQC